MNSKQLGPIGILILVALALSFLSRPLAEYTSQLFVVFGLGAAAVAAYVSTAQRGPQLGSLRDALRAISRGKKLPQLPEGAPQEMQDAYEQLGELAEKSAELSAERGELAKERDAITKERDSVARDRDKLAM